MKSKKQKGFKVYYVGLSTIFAKSRKDANEQIRKVFNDYHKSFGWDWLLVGKGSRIRPTEVSFLKRINDDLKYSTNALKEIRESIQYLCKKHNNTKKEIGKLEKYKKYKGEK